MKKVLFSLLGCVMLAVGVVAGVTPFAQETVALDLCNDPEFKEKNPDLWEAAGCREGEDRDETIFGPVEIMIRVALGLIGVVGVVVIIYGGVMYTISTGDAAKVTKAKNIILYGIVGLVVAVLAYVIVEFVSKSISG